MTWTQQSLKNPAAVAVIVAIVFLLGGLTLTRLPVQLFPNIERPVIAVQTNWRAASPQEMEAEITEPLEEVLRGIPGMTNMRTWSNPGNVWINMEFSLATDMDQTLIEVISRINRLRPLPADADRPQVIMGGWDAAGDTLIYLFTQLLPDSGVDPADLARTIREQVIPRLEAVEGVARVQLEAGGESEDQLQIVFDPVRAAQLGLDINTMAARIGRPTDISGGTIDVGRRSIQTRMEGRYTVEELSDLILAWRNNTPIRLGDVADIGIRPGPDSQVVYQNGNPAMGVRVVRESGANVLATIDRLTVVLDELNATVLKDYGLSIQKSFDPSVFIKRAISLLTNNLLIGILLAVGALWWFLRQGRATLLIATTIPICLLTTFIVLGMTGRSLNVISLAGLAFATGMVLDAAIVVLENIVRLREAGKKPLEAAELGARQVWGALLASTATTVAIFVPIIFLRDVEGQLFADLALTIAIAVGVSLVVAVTALPTAARTWLVDLPKNDAHTRRWNRLADAIMALTGAPRRRVALVAGLIVVPVTASWLMLPSLNYLPPVKRDAVDGFMQFPSGANVDTIREEFAEIVVDRLQPYMDGVKEPALRNYYIITWPDGNGGSVGVRAKDQGRIKELERIVRDEILVGFPDVVAFAQQGNLFGGFGGDGSIAMHLQSTDLDALAEVAITGVGLVRQALPGTNARPNPDPQVVSPELRLLPNDERLAEMGYSRDDVARIMRALGDGLWLGEYFDGERRVDIILRSDELTTPEALEATPLATQSGAIVPLGELVAMRLDVGPGNIQRYDGRRTITLEINPPDGMALADALAILRQQVEPRLAPMMPADGTIRYGGSADSLKQAITTLGTNFLVALGLLFLIMAALFKSPKDAALVVIAIPLATVGGVAALRILNTITFQPMDLLTMIGFIILLGLVVNNAILLVVQTRRSEEEGLSRAQAVRAALRLRLRPIFMSTVTSIAGMLPLVLFPGAGSAIYRGMAATIVGGMAVSALFTLILLPCLLQFGRARAAERPAAPAAVRSYRSQEGHGI